MLKYIVRRLLLIIPVLLGAIIIIFTINYFSTTNPAMIKLGLSANDPVLLAEMEHEMGLTSSSWAAICGICSMATWVIPISIPPQWPSSSVAVFPTP